MQVSTFLLRFRAVPLRHKIIAAGVAVAIAGGVYVLSKRGMTKSAITASLSFNPGVARQIEPGVLDANEPAVALAQSILSDDVVKAVSKQAGVSFSAAENDVTEFRSHLEFTQPSPKTLRVSYHDADQKKSATAVNTVAIILAAWTPFAVVESPPVALTTQAAPPVKPPELDQRRHHASPPSSDSLRELEARLSATDQKLASLNAEQAIASQKANATLQPPNAESEHRRLLKAQVSAAEKKLAELRVRYTDEYPDVETTQENIAEMQRELASLPPVSNEPAPVANTKGADASAAEIGQLRQDRLRLMQAIATEERREVMLREKTPPSMRDSSATVQTVSLSHPQASIPVSGNPPDHSLENPFRLVRLASLNRSNLSWPVPLSGFLCGLLYLGIATWRYRPVESVSAEAPGAMKTLGTAPTFQELPSAGIRSESKTRGLERVSVIVESNLSVDRDKALPNHRPEAAPHPANASEGGDPFGDKWERIIRDTLAQTRIGRQAETFNRNNEAPVVDNQKQVNGKDSRAQEEPSHNLKDLAEVVGGNIRDPDIWMSRTKAAQVALEVNDLDTAIREIKLAIAVTPPKLKTWLESFLVQLENDRRRLPETSRGEIPGGEAAEDTITRAIAKPVVRVSVEGLHPVLGRLIGPKDDE